MANENNQTAAPVLTSPKLEQLKADYAKAWILVCSFNTPETMFTKDAMDAKMAAYKIDGEIKAETAGLLKAQKDAEIAEARNQRLALNTAQLDAYFAWKTAPKNTPADKLAELESAFKTANEIVNNELLAKFASSRPAKVTTSTGSENGQSDSPNKAAIIEMYLAGKTHKEIEDAGYKRSTVWHTINNYKKANQPAS